VVPTLDEEGRIGACLASIGVGPGIEIVVSDGGSTDRTVDIVAGRRPEAKIVTGAPGRGAQLNRGARMASSDRLLFLHADCLLPEGWFDAVTAALDDDEFLLAVFELHTAPADGGEPGAWSRFWLGLFDLRSRGWGLPYGDQGFAMRREVFDGLGGFPDIPLMEDVEMARRCRRAGAIRRIPLAVTTTARRFEARPVRSRLILATFPTLYRIGVAPETLARWYGVVR
jgi:rSAM/selenodomain-associated transferase 2